jgi:hypothetical protein
MGVVEVLLGDREGPSGGKDPPSDSARVVGDPTLRKVVTGAAEALSHRKER